MQVSASPIVGERVTARDKRLRLMLFLVWLVLVAWLASGHVFWRDEVRAFSLALSGSNLPEMLATVHGEGHPALWYLILRGAHELFPYREVLPVAAAAIGIAAMAIVTFASPFRTIVVALVLFSFFGAFEYVVAARNYGLAALVMFALAALYPRIKDSMWLGVLIALLANTNVPSCILAGMFLLFRFVEMLTGERPAPRRQWAVFAGNALLAALGAYLCFRTIYPTFNDGAVSPKLESFGSGQLAAALVDTETGFFNLAAGLPSLVQTLLLLVSCMAFVRRPAALAAAIVGFVALKLFFYFVYPSSYRHEALFIVFLLSLHWMVARGAGGSWRAGPWMDPLRSAGGWALVLLLALQPLLLIEPVQARLAGVPYSRSADVAALLEREGLSDAILMADPDPLLEALPYYTDNPMWFLREQRFGTVTHLTADARRDLTLDQIIADAERLHRQTGRPVVFLSRLLLKPVERRPVVMYQNTTTVTPAGVHRLRASTRHVASLRPSVSDENYDVFVYPR